MALINELSTITSTTAGALSELGTVFGYNTWNLADGKYNGCTFCSPARSNSSIENMSIFENYDSVTASINAFTGNKDSTLDPNSRTQLIDTHLTLISVKSEFILQNAFKQFPFTNGGRVERLGSGGWLYSFVLQFIGEDYLKAIANLNNAINYIPEDDDSTLIHPTHGKIAGDSVVVRFDYVEDSVTWRGATVFLNILCTGAVGAPIKEKSKGQKIFDSAMAALNLVNSIFSTFIALKSYLQSVKSSISPATLSNKVSNAQAQIENSTSKLTQATNYITKNSIPPVQVSSLTNQKIDYADLPYSLNGSHTYNGTQGEIILSEYIKQIEETKLSLLLFGGYSNAVIVELEKSVTALYELTNVSASLVTNKTYKTPYPMSLSMVLFNNNIPLQNIEIIYNNNPQITSANYIEENTLVYL